MQRHGAPVVPFLQLILRNQRLSDDQRTPQIATFLERPRVGIGLPAPDLCQGFAPCRQPVVESRRGVQLKAGQQAGGIQRERGRRVVVRTSALESGDVELDLGPQGER